MTMTNRWLKIQNIKRAKKSKEILTKTNVYPFQSCFPVPIIFFFKKNLESKPYYLIFKEKNIYQLHSMLYFK